MLFPWKPPTFLESILVECLRCSSFGLALLVLLRGSKAQAQAFIKDDIRETPAAFRAVAIPRPQTLLKGKLNKYG